MDAHGQRITAVNRAARAAGVEAGAALTDARAVCPALVTQPADEAADHTTLLHLGQWAGRYSPIVALDAPDGLLIDITGCAHLFGGEEALLADLSDRLTTIGFSACLGLADTARAAFALARYTRLPGPSGQNLDGRIAPPGATEAALTPLPIASLALAPPTRLLLTRLGLKTVGSLTAIPRLSLEKRFRSPEAAENVLRRLDEALGRRETPLVPLVPPPVYAARVLYPDPALERLALETGLDRLIADLVTMLEKGGAGARALALTATHAEGTASRIEAGLARASRDAGHMRRLIAERLDSIDPGFGIDALVLDATRTEPLTPAQTGLQAGINHGAAAERTLDLLDRLANRLDPGAVTRFAANESHIPERAQQRAGLLETGAWPEPPAGRAGRPFRLFATPEAVTAVAEVPDGPPLTFTWRRVARRVVRARGPERIASEWWRNDVRDDVRDYYEVEDTDGHRYWLFREGLYQDPARQGAPRWYMHGLFG